MSTEQQHIEPETVLGEILFRNAAVPVRVTQVIFEGGGAAGCRGGFLQTLAAPLVEVDYSSIERVVVATRQRLAEIDRLGVFGQVRANIDLARDALAGDNDLVVKINMEGLNKYSVRSGVEVGGGEGSTYISGSIRNAFGGAEKVEASASVGQRTRRMGQLQIASPIRGSADRTVHMRLWENVRDMREWARCEEETKGASISLTSLFPCASSVLTLQLLCRTLTPDHLASRYLRAAAGPVQTTSLSHTFTYSTLNDTLAPSAGWQFKHLVTLSPQYLKTALSILGATRISSFSLITHTRTGIIVGSPPFSDRFFLGGPCCVRGFRQNRLGPVDNGDSLGGLAFIAASLSALYKIRNYPLYSQFFVDAGTLSNNCNSNVSSRLIPVSSLIRPPSIAFGAGIMYRHSVARVELNFTLPLIIALGERPRKGLQLGIALELGSLT